MQLALTSWPHWEAVEGCPQKHIATLGSRHRVLSTFPAASAMHLSTAAPRGMVQGSMTRGSRAAWWKWKCASVKQSALLYTTATRLGASGMPLLALTSSHLRLLSGPSLSPRLPRRGCLLNSRLPFVNPKRSELGLEHPWKASTQGQEDPPMQKACNGIQGFHAKNLWHRQPKPLQEPNSQKIRRAVQRNGYGSRPLQPSRSQEQPFQSRVPAAEVASQEQQ